jgi:hypothetical protein
MKRITKDDGPLLVQFKRWAKHLLDVNPSYVQEPKKLQDYIQGPNWDKSDPYENYAHYRSTVAAYGDELLGVFERMRAAKWGEGLDEYRGLLKQAEIEEVQR